MLFHNATVYAPGGPYASGWVLVEGRHIARMGRGVPPVIPGNETTDLGGQALTPGLIDLHAHGALGHDTMDATPEVLQDMARFYARHGVTSFLATSMANPTEHILAALQNVAQVMRAGTPGAVLLGAHVEGPYLNTERRGCQEASFVHNPDPQEYERILQTGVVRLLTLAPELPGSAALIRTARAHGTVVAAGHSRASYEQMSQAVELGVTQVTHLFNALDSLHHRQPGVVGAALALDGLSCQLIADNIHIHPAVLKLAVRAKGLERILLVTDAMSGTGMPDGAYTLGGQVVRVRRGVARTADGALAGSTLTLERALCNLMAAADLSLAQVLPLATRNPARALGLAHKGEIAVGMDADLVVLDKSLQVVLTLVGGEAAYRM